MSERMYNVMVSDACGDVVVIMVIMIVMKVSSRGKTHDYNVFLMFSQYERERERER